MAELLDPGVEKRASSPSEEEPVTLLVELSEITEGTLEDLENISPTVVVEDTLELGYIRLIAVETDLNEILDYPSIQSVEIEKGGGVMGKDFRTPAGSPL